MTQRQLNILACFHKATESELRAGLAWYADAADESERLARENKVTVKQAAGVIAAVSPGLRWERNVEVAERIIRKRTLKGLGVRWYDGVKKAKRILKGQSTETALKGNKVRAFHACILGSDLAVCVDGHAYAIWIGRRVTLDDVPTLNDKLYRRIAADYVTVAKTLNVRPCQLQAITWVAWRRLHEVAVPVAPF
jgi:hypothetical protein